jgi:Rieske Fe-S protein
MSSPPPQSTAPFPADPNRRSFFRWLTYGLGAVGTLLLAVPLVGYVFGRGKPRVLWVPLGPVDDFPPGQMRSVVFTNPLGDKWAGMTSEGMVFVRREGQDQFVVFAANCAHLGCPVSWFPQSELFMCPCHGGVYYANGERASGPPPRGLYRCYPEVRDGQLVIRAPHYPTLHNTLEEPA